MVHKTLEKDNFQIKGKILRIALKLFMERGFFEVSINDLIKEAGISKRSFNYYFNSKDQLICEAIEKLFFSHFEDVIRISDESNEISKDKLLRIFQIYSETDSYLKNNLSVKIFNYRSIICLTVEGIKDYKSMTNCIVDFNNRLLEKIEYVIENGKILGEISSRFDSKLVATHTLTLLQNAIVLWAMNQNIDMKMLFETNFKYLWNSIKSSESNLEILDNNIIDNCIEKQRETNFDFM
jgi:AcrR family transcriptional regulator